VIVGATVFATARPQFGCEAPVASASTRVVEPFGVTAESVPLTA